MVRLHMHGSLVCEVMSHLRASRHRSFVIASQERLLYVFIWLSNNRIRTERGIHRPCNFMHIVRSSVSCQTQLMPSLLLYSVSQFELVGPTSICSSLRPPMMMMLMLSMSQPSLSRLGPLHAGHKLRISLPPVDCVLLNPQPWREDSLRNVLRIIVHLLVVFFVIVEWRIILPMNCLEIVKPIARAFVQVYVSSWI